MSISYHIPDPTKISISRLKKRWYGQSPRFGLGAPMKLTPVFFAYGILVACGSSTSTSPPTQGTAYFAMDGVSCTYAGTKAITFYIAAAEVGTESLAMHWSVKRSYSANSRMNERIKGTSLLVAGRMSKVLMIKTNLLD